MYQALAHEFAEVVHLGPLQALEQPFKNKKLLYSKALQQQYLADLEPLLHRCLSAEVERKLAGIVGLDAIISPGCFPYPNVFLNAKVPVFLWADATFAGLCEIFPDYQQLCKENIWCGSQIQQLAIDKAARTIFASSWAADSAVETYDADRNKVRVIPYGANIQSTIANDTHLQSVLEARAKTKNCRLLMVARRWEAQNGNFAFAVVKALCAAGIDVTFTLAGCDMPPSVEHHAVSGLTVEAYPTLNKHPVHGDQSYTALLASAHFLLHPSASTCFGIAMCEANAWGLPVLCQNAGGASSVITHGKNGYIFDTAATPEAYAEAILSAISSKESYSALCMQSWQEYRSRLNWKTAASEVGAFLRETC